METASWCPSSTFFGSLHPIPPVGFLHGGAELSRHAVLCRPRAASPRPAVASARAAEAEKPLHSAILQSPRCRQMTYYHVSRSSTSTQEIIPHRDKARPGRRTRAGGQGRVVVGGDAYPRPPPGLPGLPGRVRLDRLPPRHQQRRRTGRPNMLVQWDFDAPKVDPDVIGVYGLGRSWQTHDRTA